MLEIDEQRRKATLNGRELALQDKAWQVLWFIHRAQPNSLSRRELIAEVWNGNAFTGEKGLNQALWAIRNQLDDNAREPRYIQTLPRQGYRWISTSQSANRNYRWYGLVVGSLLVFAIALLATPPNSAAPNTAYTLPPRCDLSQGARAHAYRRNSDVVIDIDDFCRLIVTPSGDKQFGKPVMSSDGFHVAFEVKEGQHCKLVTFAIENGRRAEFEQCTELSATST